METTIKESTYFKDIITELTKLIDDFWIFMIAILGAVVIIWCVYVGVKLIVAHRNEERVDAKKMIKNLLVGIVIIFVLAVGVPLLIDGLSSWSGIGVGA